MGSSPSLAYAVGQKPKGTKPYGYRLIVFDCTSGFGKTLNPTAKYLTTPSPLDYSKHF